MYYIIFKLEILDEIPMPYFIRIMKSLKNGKKMNFFVAI